MPGLASRSGLADKSPAATKVDKELSNLLAHVPIVSVTGSEVAQKRDNLNRKRFITCVKLLWAHPGVRADAQTWIEELVEDTEKKDNAVGADMFDSVTTAGKLEVFWQKQFWCRRLKVDDSSMKKGT